MHTGRIDLRGALVILLLTAGCGLFSTRTPSEPQAAPPRHDPILPDSVLYNFQIGISYKQDGTANISEALADDFAFTLDASDQSSICPGVTTITKAQMDRGLNTFYLTRVKTSNLDLVVHLDQAIRKDETPPLTTYINAPYQMVIFTLNNRGERVVSLTICGTTDIGFRQLENGKYALSSWVDKGGACGSTFGGEICKGASS